MTSSDRVTSAGGTVQIWIDGLQAITTILIFMASIAWGILGAYLGHWWALLLIPAGWLITALDPQIGRWKHVWE